MKLYQVRTKTYEKSFRKLYKSKILNLERLNKIIDMIASGEDLPHSCNDHKLHGDLKNYRECHIQPDLLLIYQIREKELILILFNIGSHSDLFR